MSKSQAGLPFIENIKQSSDYMCRGVEMTINCWNVVTAQPCTFFKKSFNRIALTVPHRLLMNVMVLHLLYFICYFICFVTGILIRKCFLKSTSLILRIWPQAKPFHEENYSSFLLEWLCNWRWPNCRYNNVCNVKSLT